MAGSELNQLIGEWHGPGAAYLRLMESIRLLILDGRIPLATRLPSERDLAIALGVSRTTTTTAYQALREAGYADSRQGSGTWTTLPKNRDLRENGAPWAPFAPDGGDMINLAHASPGAPAQDLRQAYAAALEELTQYLPGSGYFLRGLPALRAAVADRFSARGLPTSPDQILITAGAQHAFSLVLSLITSPGDRVLVEHPAYPNTLDAVRRAGRRLVPVSMLDDGWDIPAVEATLRQAPPRLVFVIPDFQNPSGLLASDDDRAAIASLVTRSRTVTVIDETLVELPLDVAMPGPFATHVAANDELMITVGGMSKAFWGGLRVGWIRAEAGLIRRLAAARATTDLGSAVLEQLACVHVLQRLDDILPAHRQELRNRRDAFVKALATHLPDWRVRVPKGGLALWYDIGTPVSSQLVSAAERHGLQLAAGPRFGVDGAFEQRLRLPFTHPADVLTDAVPRLAAAFQSVTDGDRRSLDSLA